MNQAKSAKYCNKPSDFTMKRRLYFSNLVPFMLTLLKSYYCKSYVANKRRVRYLWLPKLAKATQQPKKGI